MLAVMGDGDKARNYRERAEELRTIAQDFADAQSRKMLTKLALDYERMAEQVEQVADLRDETGLNPGPVVP